MTRCVAGENFHFTLRSQGGLYKGHNPQIGFIATRSLNRYPTAINTTGIPAYFEQTQRVPTGHPGVCLCDVSGATNEHRSALRGTSPFGFAGVPNPPNIKLALLKHKERARVSPLRFSWALIEQRNATNPLCATGLVRLLRSTLSWLAVLGAVQCWTL